MTALFSANRLASLASLMAEPARAAMVLSLMDGRALSAGELAKAAHISAQTASGHLAKLLAGNMLRFHAQGRHRYYTLASPEVAALVEQMGCFAAHPVVHTGPKAPEMRQARRCYDHLAGRLGVKLTDALIDLGHLREADGIGVVTEQGQAFFCDFGIDLNAQHRPLCRLCMDWSERRFHLGGALGAGLLGAFLQRNWLRPLEGSRALALTPQGKRGFGAQFAIPDMF